jgi:PIN domain nuclease of toxin-antitoxin system
MIEGLLLDTHIALWLDSGDKRLRPETRAVVDTCWLRGGVIYLSAVSAWEIALLADLDRIVLDLAPPQWVARFLDRPGIAAAALDWRAASAAYRLDGFGHRDPADRLLVATAIALSCPMVTYDARIAAFAAEHGRLHGFSVASDTVREEPGVGHSL